MSARLLQRWRERPCVELAEALDDELRVTKPNAAPADLRNWRERIAVASRDDVPELAALLGSLRDGTIDDIRLRVNGLGHVLPDPRVARVLGDLMLTVPFDTPPSMALWGEVFDMLARAGDPRALAWIEQVRRTFVARRKFEAFFRAHLDALESKLRARFPDGAPPIDDDTRSLLPAPKATRSTDALLAEVFAHPEDDGPRLVLADFLLETGDPRGELIILQCTGRVPARVRRLLAAHGDEWLGELRPFVSGKVGFARGFPATARLHFKNAMQARLANDVAAFATLEDVDVGAVKTLPRTLRGVRSLRNVSEEAFESLRRDCPHLRPHTLQFACAVRGLERLGPLLDDLTHLTVVEYLAEAHLDAVVARPKLVIELLLGSVKLRVAMIEGSLTLTYVVALLGELGQSLVGWELDRFFQPVGRSSIQRVVVERARGPGDAAEIEAQFLARLLDYIDSLQALETFDLTALGGPSR